MFLGVLEEYFVKKINEFREKEYTALKSEEKSALAECV
jgi:hypothetical protein